MSEKLKKITAEEWDCWLTVHADCQAPKNDCATCIYFEHDDCKRCRVCDAFGDDCAECQGALTLAEAFLACNRIDPVERIDRVIERLEDAGVFDKEGI